MIKKLKAFKIWDKKYSRPYYQYKNKIFHSVEDFYKFIKDNKIDLQGILQKYALLSLLFSSKLKLL